MADKWLKFTFQIYVDITSGTKYMTLSSDLPMSAFPNNNLLYQLNYGTGDILSNVRMPGKLRLYQFITKFNNHNLLDVMNPNGTNKVLTDTDPDNINNVPVNPLDEELIYTSGLGTENTYIGQVYESAVGHRVYVSHNEIFMGSQKTPEVSTQTTITCENIYLFHDDEMDLYNALLESYPNNVTPYNPYSDPWTIDNTGLNLPYRVEFPPLYDYSNILPWYIDNTGLNLPYREEFPPMHEYTYDTPWLIDNTGENLPYREEFPEMYELPRRYTDPAPPPSWFSFKGRSCTEFGCILEKLPLNIRNELATKIIDMPENTPFVQEPSGWKTRVITVTLGLKDTSNENIDAINSWLIGQGRLIFSDDPDRHYIATCNGTLTGNRLLRLGKLPVQFIIMPHKRNNDESMKTYAITNGTVSIENKGTAPCEPVLVITGDGDITLTHTQSGTEITIKDVDGKCTVDVSRRKVYDALNNVILSQVSGNLTDLKLSPKTVNQIVTTGSVTKIEAILNERWL